jgi:HEAT repeat protein
VVQNRANLHVPKPNPLDRKLEALYRLEDDPAKIFETLPPFLRDKSNIIVAKAANMAVRLEASALVGDLTSAFLSILRDAEKNDPGCVALTAIAKALITFDAPVAEVYFAGLRHFQRDPSYGGRTEVAGELRGLSARGLARIGHPEALLFILPLMADSLPARVGAVRAIAETGKAEAELLLRLHVIRGDFDIEVIGECFTGLLGLIPQRSVGFVGTYLQSNEESVAEMAALTLGESRLTAAFPVLRDAWQGELLSSVRRAVLFAIAALRRDEALEWLLSLLRDGGPDSAGVIAALAIHKSDEALKARVRQAVEVRGSNHLQTLYEKAWT